MKYIAKPNTWYDEGTEAVPVSDFWTLHLIKKNCFLTWIKYETSAVFCGIKDGKEDEEVCCINEFNIIQ